MEFPSTLVQWEWAIGEGIVLALLFWELYRLRRSQRRDREEAARRASAAEAAGHPEGQHGLHPGGGKPRE